MNLTWQQWDAIADSVNPALALLALAAPWILKSHHPTPSRLRWYSAICGAMATMYLLVALERSQLDLWARLGANYSGHTGFAVVLLASIAFWQRKTWIAGAVVLIAYATLMVYQRYHTVADIVTTVAVIGGLTVGAHSLVGRLTARSRLSISAAE